MARAAADKAIRAVIREEFILESLKEAVGLAKDKGFKSKRARMYSWQDDIIQNKIPTKDLPNRGPGFLYGAC